MDDHNRKLFEARARVMKALAHPTRLFLLEELRRGECCVCELTERVGADMSTVSRHLKILKDVRVIESEKRGTQIWYSLAMPCVLNFFVCVEKILAETARHLADVCSADQDSRR